MKRSADDVVVEAQRLRELDVDPFGPRLEPILVAQGVQDDLLVVEEAWVRLQEARALDLRGRKHDGAVAAPRVRG